MKFKFKIIFLVHLIFANFDDYDEDYDDEEELGFGRITDTIWFEIEAGGYLQGFITIGLFNEIVPITCKNFMQLALNDHYPSYRGTIIHRISEWMIQGGDVEYKDGNGGISIYGKAFADENFQIKHNRKGYVAMSNSGEDTNHSQFYIITKRTYWLDGEFVVFGKVIDGWDVVRKLQNEPVAEDDHYPKRKIQVVATGHKRLLNPLVVNFADDAMQALQEDKPDEEEELPDDIQSIEDADDISSVHNEL